MPDAGTNAPAAPSPATPAPAPQGPAVGGNRALAALLTELSVAHPDLELRAPGPQTVGYRRDASGGGPSGNASGVHGPAVVFPTRVNQVQAVVLTAAAHGITVVPRGAGTGLSGGANAQAEQLVLSTERLNHIVEISPADGIAVVEPGVLTADLSRAAAPHGLMYAPDPASAEISTLGGNLATNAGGLHCVKYGVTRESVLALDVVLADGELISVGHRSIKGVVGFDLVSLFVGSEGTLGIIVGATLRLRQIPVAVCTLTAAFPDTQAGARALGVIRGTGVQPAAVEFLDGGTLAAIDSFSGSTLSERGGALALIELDGFGLEEQVAAITAALTGAGAQVQRETDAEAAELWRLRRTGLGFPASVAFLGGDTAVPLSRIAELYAALPDIAQRHGVDVFAVAHAGDGNLHPVASAVAGVGREAAAVDAALHAAQEDIVTVALALGGTVSGEHGVGTHKRAAAARELSPRVLALHAAIATACDPHGTLNPETAY